jgi:hypothetical protein
MTQPLFTPAQTLRFRAAAQSLRVWFCEMLLWLAAYCGGWMGADVRAFARAELADARAMVRMLLVLLALAQRRPAPAAAARHPFGAPRGFAPARFAGSDLRHATRAVRLGGRGLAGRFARLRAVIDDLDAQVARVVRRLATPGRQRAPRAVRPPARVCAGVAGVNVAISDSS